MTPVYIIINSEEEYSVQAVKRFDKVKDTFLDYSKCSSDDILFLPITGDIDDIDYNDLLERNENSIFILTSSHNAFSFDFYYEIPDDLRKNFFIFRVRTSDNAPIIYSTYYDNCWAEIKGVPLSECSKVEVITRMSAIIQKNKISKIKEVAAYSQSHKTPNSEIMEVDFESDSFKTPIFKIQYDRRILLIL